MVRARCCKYFTCFNPTEYRDTTTFDINREIWNMFIYNEKKSKREIFLTKNYSWQLSGAFLRNFFLVQFFSLGQLSVPCLLIIFFSGNFFSRLIFLLGQLSGACLFIKTNSQKVFYAEAIHFSGAVIWCLSPHKWPKGQETPFLSYYSVLS